MNIKKFFAVLCPLLIIVFLVVGVAAYSYPELYTKEATKKKNNEQEFQIADGSFNVLLIGRDKGGKLTDTIMFAHVDNDNGRVNIISIPRDTYVDGWKINAMYSIGGIESTVDCVEDIIGLDVDYYVSITTDVFRDIVDELDGVDFYVPQNMDYDDPVQGLYIHLTEGQQHLDGDKAEQLVRFRSYIHGDIQRTQVQRDFMQALISQKKSLKYINRVDEIYRNIADKIETNLTLEDILANIITFKNLDVVNNLNAHVMPNEPRNVGGISYVFVLHDELKELLVNEFWIDEDDINDRSGAHAYYTGGGYEDYTSYDSSYDDSTAWYEPVAPEETTGDETDEEYEGDYTGEGDVSSDFEYDTEVPAQPDDSDSIIPEITVPDAAEPDSSYVEYPDAAGVPLD